MPFCGNIPVDVWEYLRNSSTGTTETCTALSLLDAGFGSCEPPCDIAGISTDAIIHQLFGVDGAGKTGLRVMFLTADASARPCTPILPGQDSIWPYIGTATDGKPALKVAITVI